MREFLLRTPFFRLFLALVVGVLLFECLSFSWILPVLLVLSVLSIILHFLSNKKDNYKLRWLFGCGVFLFFASLSFYLSQSKAERLQTYDVERAAVYKAIVKKAPVEKPKSYMLEVENVALAYDSLHFQDTEGRLLLYVQKTDEAGSLRIGDELLFAATLKKPLGAKNPEAFDYSKYLKRKGIGATAYVNSSQWRLVKKSDAFSVFQLASDCRRYLLSVYREYNISGDEFAVLAALTLGYKDEIPDDLYLSYSNSGALHILSVSGLHVGVLFLILSLCLSFLNKTAKTRFLKSLLIIILLWGFAFITGLSASVMRASLMFSVLSLGNVFSYKSNVYNAIFFSAFVLLLINPSALFDVSFLLSYSAVLSIVYFQPRFKRLLFFENNLLNWSWDLFCVSIAAQIGTFPIGLYFFHKFSNHFLLTNFLAIPLATGIIYLAVLLLVFSALPQIASWIALLLQYLLKAQNKSVLFVDGLPNATLQTWIGSWEVVLLYALILASTLYVLKKNTRFLFLSLVLVVGFAGLRLYRNYEGYVHAKLYVYADNKSTSIDVFHGGKHVLYSTDIDRIKSIMTPFWLKMQVGDCEKGKSLSGIDFFEVNNARFAVLTDDSLRNKTSNKLCDVDYLVIGNHTKFKYEDLTGMFSFRNLIADSSISKWKMKQLKEKCNANGIRFYSTDENGAFQL